MVDEGFFVFVFLDVSSSLLFSLFFLLVTSCACSWITFAHLGCMGLYIVPLLWYVDGPAAENVEMPSGISGFLCMVLFVVVSCSVG